LGLLLTLMPLSRVAVAATDAVPSAPLSRVVTFCVDPDWPPFEQIDAQGQHIGIAADLLRLVAQRSGLTLQLLPTKDWDQSLAASQAGRCELMSFLNQSAKRDGWLLFTDPVLVDENVLITREEHSYVSDLAALAGETMVLPKGTSVEERLRRDFPNLKIVQVESEAQAFKLVSERQADLTMRSLIVAADGKTAYYASERSDSRGALDLYRFLLPDDMRPPATFWVKGRVYDAKTREGLPSTVELTDLNTRRIISRLQTDELGNYLTTLPVGSQYLFNVNRKGYLFFSENYRLEREQTDSFFTADIPLQPIEPGAVIVLKNIFFETNKSTLNPASRIELDKVVQLMTDNPTMKILISGHTDNVGKAADNTKLSLDRAQAVVNYLLGSQKIAKERLTAKGWGAAKPIAENSTESGRARNRRTELEVTGN
jgi:outer membrane protein OmpA-like peptidoglycan-associated protein/ABC-type amino acid transport substrate-binding protein